MALLLSTDLRRRIELIQDFSMPTASTDIQATADGQYIIAAGGACYISGLKPSDLCMCVSASLEELVVVQVCTNLVSDATMSTSFP